MVKPKARSAAKTARKSDKHSVAKPRPPTKKSGQPIQDSNSSDSGHHAKSAGPGHPPGPGPDGQTPPLSPAQISTFKSSSGVDLTEKVKELVRLAQEQGYLTYNDINDALPDNIVSPEVL